MVLTPEQVSIIDKTYTVNSLDSEVGFNFQFVISMQLIQIVIF